MLRNTIFETPVTNRLRDKAESSTRWVEFRPESLRHCPFRHGM